MAKYLVTYTMEVPTMEDDTWPTMVENCVVDADDAGDAAYIVEDMFPDVYVVYVGELDQIEYYDNPPPDKKVLDKVVDGNIICVNFGRKDK